MTWEFLSDGSALQEQVVSFAIGSCALSQLPGLRARVKLFLFVPVPERRGEGDYSITHKAACGRTNDGAAVSLSLRIPEVEEHIATQGSARSLADRFDERFGLSQRPLLVGVQGDKQSSA